MNSEQTNEVYKAVDCMKETRKHLDNAMYRLGDIDDADIAKLRRVYNHICEALDEL